jgi:RHS repeat-associated protein
LLYQPAPGIADGTPNLNDQAVLYDDGTPFANLTPGPLNAQGFHIGGDNNGDLGPLNLTAVPNGIYELILNVRGGGYQTNALVEVQLDSQLKIGQFSFSQQDMVLPVNGVPITVTRTYNSLNQNAADFGYSWTYALNNMNVQLDETRQDVSVGGNQDAYSSGPPGTYSVRTGGGYDLTLTLPNGQQTTFAFSLGGGPDEDSESAQWTPPPWVHATLTPLDPNGTPDQYADTIYYLNTPPTWGNLANIEGTSAPLANQDLPGWVLTTQPDGTEYFITRGNPTNIVYPDPINAGSSISATVYGPPMLTQIVQRSGDTIVISPSSIYHQDTNGIDRVVNFTRDAWGRITAISDPNGSTNGFPAIQYIYNQSTSNLIQVLKLVNRATGAYTTNSYDYNNPNFPHYITSMENGDGVSVARNYYDNSGRLTSMQDAYGNLTQYIYPSTNNEMIVDPLGRTNSYLYDINGNVLAQTNALGQITTMAYDVNNNKTNQVTYLNNGQPYATNSYVYSLTLNLPLSSTDPLGHTTTFVYDSFGDLCTNTDAMNHSTTNIYDSNGNLLYTSDVLGDTTVNIYNGTLLASSSDPIGTTTYNSYDTSEDLIGTATVVSTNRILGTNSYTYDNNGNRLTSTVWRHAANGSWTPATTTNIYDAQNRVIETIDPDGGTNTIIYNAINKQQATIDPRGNTTSYNYDDQGRLIQTIYPDGTSETSAYDAVGNRTNSVDRDGHVTTYQYDALNRLTNTIYADNSTSTTVYDSVGRVAQTIDPRGTITAFAYDVAGRRLAVTNAFGITGIQSVSSYSYDNNGNQITFTDANHHTTTNVFDSINRQVQVEYPNGTTTFTVYDADSRSVIQTNQDRLATWFGYDGVGRLIAVTNALGQVTRYQYDEAGNQTNQIDALNRTNAYAFDGMGRRISHMMPGGQVEGFAYDLASNLTNQTNFNGAVITNQYNSVNRLTNCSSINGYNVRFAYSPTGQRTSMVDASGTTTYGYDIRDRLLSKTNSWNSGPTVVLNYGYDANGNVTNIWATNGVNLAYSYDPLNRLTNVLANGNAAAAYGFDLAGNLQAMRYGNGVTNLCQYDSLNRLTNLTWNLNASSLANFSYLLGATGNRTNLTEKVNGTNLVYAWQYDPLYRLTNEFFNASSNLAYNYDPVGNRTNRNPAIAGVAGTVAGLTNQNFTFGTNDWLTTDHYDNNGNTTNSSNITNSYDVMDHLTNMNGTVFMAYDGDGNRVSKTNAGTTGANTFYLVDDRNPSGYAQVLEELIVSNGVTSLSKVYNYGLNLISQQQTNSSTNYFVYDGHGSTRLLISIGGNVVNQFTYDAYGSLIASNTSPQTAYLYCGQQFDSTLGLYYNRARYLNPNTGRFWTMDTDEGDNEDPLSLHKYLYAEADPMDNDDPTGNAAFSSADSAAIGRQVHTIIGQAFQSPPFRITGQSVFTIAGLPNPVKKLGQKLGRLFPDLVDIQKREIYEIKPVTIAGTAAGFAQLYAYVKLLNKLWPPATWHDGNSYDYKNAEGLDTIELASPPCVVIVAPTVSGMIYYEPITLQNVVNTMAKNVGEEEEADLEDSEGIASEDAEMGAE